jgi:hypothetical protein
MASLVVVCPGCGVSLTLPVDISYECADDGLKSVWLVDPAGHGCLVDPPLDVGWLSIPGAW